MTSRFINPNVNRSDNRAPSVEAVGRRAGSNLQLTVSASDDQSLSRLTVIEKVAGGGRELLWSKELRVPSHQSQIVVQPFRPGQFGEFQVIAIDTGGNFAYSQWLRP